MTEENDFVEISWSVTGTTDSIRINAAEVDNFLLKARVLSDTARIANVGLAPIKNGGQIDAPKITKANKRINDRQREVLKLCNEGLTQSTIAKRLAVCESTIKRDYKALGLSRE